MKSADRVRLKSLCSCQDFQTSLWNPFARPELDRASQKLKRKVTLRISFESAYLILPICPGYRAKCPQHADSYRPISLTSNVAKVVKRLVVTRLLDFFEHTCAFCDAQRVSNLDKNTEDQAESISSCTRFKNQRDKHTVLALIDFSRAFNKVWHVALTHNLLRVGTPKYCVRLLRQYLSDRRACVVVHGKLSCKWIFPAGVTHGSLLSPLLFLVYRVELYLPK